MKRLLSLTIIFFSILINYSILKSQSYSIDDFIGRWQGTIESKQWEYSEDITLTLKADGTYTESSGHLMPDIYPNTQTWDIDYENNRLHFQYLKIVYAGMRTYQHFYYNIVDFNKNMFELHYNFWNDPEPSPDVQKLILSKLPTNVNELNSGNEKKLIRVIDFYGRELPLDAKEIPAIYQYDDGTIEKKYIQD